MWPFKRNKKPTNAKAPKEVQQYYASEHRERVGLAWIIAFISLIITVAVVLGLFFGGHWAYRQIANKNDNPTPAKPQTTASQPKPSTESTSSSSSSAKPQSSSQQPSTNQPQTSSTSTGVPSQPAASTPAQTSAPNKTPTATTQAPSKNITNTGPGETVAVFVGISLLGTVAYQAYLRRKAVRI